MLTQQRISELYKLYYGSLYAFIYKMVYDSGHSEDILQDCFANLIVYSSRYVVVDINIKSFFYKTAKNLALNYLKRKKMINFISLNDINLNNAFLIFNQSFDIESEMPLILNKFEKNIASFKEQTREVFWLKVLKNLSDSEIAVRLNISTRTVRRKFLEVKNFLRMNFELSD